MVSKLLQHIELNSSNKKKMLAILIDPDHADELRIKNLLQLAEGKADLLFVGGSLVTHGSMDITLKIIKKYSALPCIIFPGSPSQISQYGDAIFLLSLISGRNPELLIGKHVEAAPSLAQSQLEIIPTGYVLIDGGRVTTVSYVSSTVPIPSDKTGIAAVTALAGEQLGLKVIYMDAGSGAEIAISEEMIAAVRKSVKIPVIVGGGIKTKEGIHKAWNAGADVVVIGNQLEKQPELLDDL